MCRLATYVQQLVPQLVSQEQRSNKFADNFWKDGCVRKRVCVALPLAGGEAVFLCVCVCCARKKQADEIHFDYLR